MSTRAAIAMRLPGNTIHAIYCHNDGYPGWTGAVLGGFYKTEERVKALLALGALRSVQELCPNNAWRSVPGTWCTGIRQ